MSTGTSTAADATATPASDDVDMDVDVARLKAAVLRLSRHLRKHDVAGLTPTQLSALATVAREAPIRLGDLAAAERIAPSTLTRLVSALEERGYVRRAPVPGDARASLISATPSGSAILDRIRQETTTLLTDNLRHLSAGERAALTAALPALEHLSET
jgi:DNA-binding MarR family transcriptional regulator